MIRSLPIAASAPLLFLLIAACQADLRPEDPVTASAGGDGALAFAGYDSAGIRIVEVPEDAWPEDATWCLGPEPGLSIGTLDGPPEYELANVSAALRLDDGTVVVSNAGSGEVRFYGADGSHLSSVGRRGEGPGEFRYASLLARFGRDSLLVWDGLLARGTLLGKDGSLGRTISKPDLGASVSILGTFGDGSLLGHVSAPMDPRTLPMGLVRQHATYFRLAPEGEVDTIGRLFVGEGFSSPGSYRYRFPFQRRAVAAAAGTLMHYGSSDTYEIRTYSSTGELVRIIRSARASPLSRREIEAELEAGNADSKEALSRISYPETKPAYSAMKASADGNLWVRDYIERGEGDAAQRWTVFGAAGDLRGWVSTPPRFTVHDIGTDYVLGVGRDELDVERILLYPLTVGRCGS